MDPQLLIPETLEPASFKQRPWKDMKKMYRKLTLWHTPTLAPILTHDKLEPIMASINFFPIVSGPASTDSLMKELQVQTGTTSAGRENDGVNGEQGENLQEDKVALTGKKLVQWRKYRFISMNLIKGSGLYCEMRSWPRLPYPSVDGLHLKSYLAFLGALECFIDPQVVANMFHIRAMPMDSIDEIYKTVYRHMMNFQLDPEIEELVGYYYREDTLDDTSEETYGRLKASVGNEISKYVRKDGTRKIEEDEKDDSSDFVCLIDQGEALCGDGYHGELSRDQSLVGASDDLRRDYWKNSEACCSSSFDNLSDLMGGGKKNVHRRKRTVVKKGPQLVDIYKEVLESLQ